MNKSPIGGVIALLYSEFSNSCTKLRQQLLTDEFLPFFQLICVDSEEVRSIIQSSENIQIHTVPCVIHIQDDGNVLTFENEKAFEWIMQFVKLAQQFVKKPLVTQGGMPISSLQQLGISTPAYLPSQESLPVEQPAPGLQGRYPGSIKMKEVQPDIPSRSRRAPFEAMREITHAAEEEYEQQEELPSHKPPVKLIQDLSNIMEEDESEPLLEEDPSGMGVPRTDDIPIAGGKQPIKPQNSDMSGMGSSRPGQEGKWARTERGKAIKNMAKNLSKMRENDTAQQNSSRIAPLQPQRKAAMKTKL